MKEAKLIIDGKEYTVQMKDEDVKAVTRPKTGYEFSDEGNIYYVTDKKLAEDVTRAYRLHYRLRRWQALNDVPVNWADDDFYEKYCIEYFYDDKELGYTRSVLWKTFGTIYFSSEDVVQAAIREFKDELTWYFTEFKQRLDERTIK